MKPSCECCDVDLPPASTAAVICSYECTFCADCVEGPLGGACPNCGGGFAPRPVRPAVKLVKVPPQAARVLKDHPGCRRVA